MPSLKNIDSFEKVQFQQLDTKLNPNPGDGVQPRHMNVFLSAKLQLFSVGELTV